MKIIFGIITVVFVGYGLQALGASALNLGAARPMVFEGIFSLLLAAVFGAFAFQKRF